MLKEIYLRNPDDPLYRPDVLEHSSSLENLVGQIRMLLFTKKGDVMGSYDFGVDLEGDIFSLNLSQSALETKIRDQVYRYCPDASNFGVTVDVKFFRGTVRDIVLIDIIIDETKVLGVIVT